MSLRRRSAQLKMVRETAGHQYKGIFAQSMTSHHVKTVDARKDCWNRERKLGVATHFSEIIEPSAWTENHDVHNYIVLYLEGF